MLSEFSFANSSHSSDGNVAYCYSECYLALWVAAIISPICLISGPAITTNKGGSVTQRALLDVSSLESRV